MSSSINYARLEGIQHKELGAAILFAILYIPCIPIFIYLSFTRYTSVWRSLALFAAARSAAFVLRALLAGNSSSGTNLNLVIAQIVLYGIGFFGLLYSAYTLALDRDMFVTVRTFQAPGPLAIITRIMRNRMLIRLVLLAAVVMAIVSGTQQNSGSQSDQDTANSLRKASLYIFLVVSCLLFLLALMLGSDEFSAGVTHEPGASIGRRYGTFVIFTIAIMCIIREAYLCATAGNVLKQNEPQLFYPLSATTEYIAMVLFLIPGLVPSKHELDMLKSQGKNIQGRDSEVMPMNTMSQYAYRA